MLRTIAQRDRRIPSGPGFCSWARLNISQQHALDLPLPTGPITARTNAWQLWNRLSVGLASYLIVFACSINHHLKADALGALYLLFID